MPRPMLEAKNEVVVALVSSVCPTRVVEASTFANVELSTPLIVVEPITERVPVAVIFDAVTLPLKNPLPATDSVANGEVVPIPTLPRK